MIMIIKVKSYYMTCSLRTYTYKVLSQCKIKGAAHAIQHTRKYESTLAVDAILRVDHKLLVDIFINAGGAEARLQTRVHRQAHAFGNVGDVRLDPKVGRLITRPHGTYWNSADS